MERHKPIFLSSAQASNKDLTKGKCTWFFQTPMQINGGQIGLAEFSYTNFFINISAALGNNKIYLSDDANNNTKYAITLGDGSYEYSSLNDFIGAWQQATLGKKIFSIQANMNTNQIAIVFDNVTGWYVYWGAGSCYAINGFTSGQYVPASKSCTAYYVEYGPSVAQYGNVKSLQLSCDVTTDTISNGKSSNVIFQSTPNVDVGMTQSDRPFNIIYCNLTNSNFSSITIQVFDQDDVPINFSYEFSLSLLIKYA